MKKLLLIIGMMMFVGGGVSPVSGAEAEGNRNCVLVCAQTGITYGCSGFCRITHSAGCTTLKCGLFGNDETCCDGENSGV